MISSNGLTHFFQYGHALGIENGVFVRDVGGHDQIDGHGDRGRCHAYTSSHSIQTPLTGASPNYSLYCLPSFFCLSSLRYGRQHDASK